MWYRWFIAALLLWPLIADAEIYRWKDEHGNWQFGDRAPDTDHESMDVKGPAKLGQDSNVRDIHQRTLRLLESERTQREEEEALADKQRQKRDQTLAPLCQQARERIKKLNGPFIYIDEDGSQRDSLREEALADIAKTKKWIAENCDDY